MDKWYNINKYNPINNCFYITETTEKELITNYIHWNYHFGFTININKEKNI